MQYRLNGRLLFAENEEVTGRIYTHVVMQGDRVLRCKTSLAEAQADLADLVEQEIETGRRMRALFDRRMTQGIMEGRSPAPGGSALETLYPTQNELWQAILRQRAICRSYHVEVLD